MTLIQAVALWFAIDFPAVADMINDDQLLRQKDLIEDAIIADSQFVKLGKITAQRLQPNITAQGCCF
jgi:hypothetical protein